ncbi:MAG: hypothetical protein IJ343_10525 [Clostridia bacterium]|nr:hypothetical protein [Clostridia bacterium]
MANRPVFIFGDETRPVYRRDVEFDWNAGQSATQKRKNIVALHEAFNETEPEMKVLEISSKSLQEAGVRLSAFNLTKFVPSLGRSIPLECVFQGGKVFSGGGPFTDLYGGNSREAKQDPRLRSSGVLVNYWFEGRKVPSFPTTAFYNWLYANALLENPGLAEEIVKYDAFTDIEFNPNKSRNCQAEAAAVFVGLARRGLLDEVRDFDRFVKLL